MSEQARDWWNPNSPVPIETFNAPAVKENTVDIEDPNMWQQVSTFIANRLTSASDLEKRVKALEITIENLEVQLRSARDNALAQEAARLEVEQQLKEVQVKLDHEQRAVHDLVMERDIVVEERNKAQSERDEAKRDRDFWMNGHASQLVELEQQVERNKVLEERCALLTQRIATLREAWGGLQNL